MKRSAARIKTVGVVTGGLLLLAGFVNFSLERDAGFPHGLTEIGGHWVLDHARGTFDVAPPETLDFTAGSAAGLRRVSDGQRTADFSVQGAGRFVFAEGQRFEPLLRAGASEVHTMTHLCPPLPAWDHLIFYPDGAPHGPMLRVIVYERE